MREPAAEMPLMLRNHELGTFLKTGTDSVDFARDGEVANGYTAHLATPRRAH
jgi:hypothetical protein